jgi:hypothetical protein
MKFIKLDSPKLGEIVLNVNCIVYLKRAGVGDTKTFIHTTNGTIGVKQTMEEIGATILNV